MLAIFIHEDVCKLSMMFYLNLFYIIFVLFPNGINDHTFHLVDIDGGTDWWEFLSFWKTTCNKSWWYHKPCDKEEIPKYRLLGIEMDMVRWCDGAIPGFLKNIVKYTFEYKSLLLWKEGTCESTTQLTRWRTQQQQDNLLAHLTARTVHGR